MVLHSLESPTPPLEKTKKTSQIFVVVGPEIYSVVIDLAPCNKMRPMLITNVQKLY